MASSLDSANYSSIVSRDSMHNTFLAASHHQVDFIAYDISNTYLIAPCRENIWFEAGKEFGENKGKVILIKRALYGLKTLGASWQKMSVGIIVDKGGLGFVQTTQTLMCTLDWWSSQIITDTMKWLWCMSMTYYSFLTRPRKYLTLFPSFMS